MMTKDERAQAVEQLGVLADRVAQERRMCSDCESWDHCERDGCALLHKVALSIAAKPADVEPVRHGYWDDSIDGITPYCSVCGHSHRLMRRILPYCPECGAKMDGGDEENEN